MMVAGGFYLPGRKKELAQADVSSFAQGTADWFYRTKLGSTCFTLTCPAEECTLSPVCCAEVLKTAPGVL